MPVASTAELRDLLAARSVPDPGAQRRQRTDRLRLAAPGSVRHADSPIAGQRQVGPIPVPDAVLAYINAHGLYRASN